MFKTKSKPIKSEKKDNKKLWVYNEDINFPEKLEGNKYHRVSIKRIIRVANASGVYITHRVKDFKDNQTIDGTVRIIEPLDVRRVYNKNIFGHIIITEEVTFEHQHIFANTNKRRDNKSRDPVFGKLLEVKTLEDTFKPKKEKDWTLVALFSVIFLVAGVALGALMILYG